MKKKLNAKEQAFVDSYLLTMSASQAAKDAGYEFVKAPPKDGYYIYGLVCPIRNDLFYVGKGKDGRMLSHAKLNQGNKSKNQRITQIHESGLAVMYLVFSTHIDESEAYSVESHLMSVIGFDRLTNFDVKAGLTMPREVVETFLPKRRDFNNDADWCGECVRRLNNTEGSITFLGAVMSLQQTKDIIGMFKRNYIRLQVLSNTGLESHG